MKVPADTQQLHIIAPQDAIATFEHALGSGTAWASPLMQYRTTSDFQEDWKIEVGNWLEQGRRFGYYDRLVGELQPQRLAQGTRDEADAVHRNVTQRLHQAMLVHYLVQTGWRFQAMSR